LAAASQRRPVWRERETGLACGSEEGKMAGMIGKEIGSYRIIEQIGTGGMATVYRAYHATMDRYVAVKVLPEQMSQDESFRRRFEQEVKVVARLKHAHILPVHDYGEVEGRLYLVMRYIEAGTLKDRLARGPLDLAEVSCIIRQVGRALEYAHRMGVVHRDVKPSNVLVDAEGNCYLTDFGLARMLEASVQLTATGVVGTPDYMSPEQGRGERVDARSDVYSLGVMLYEMVTGRVPYEAETPLAVILKHITAPLPLPREVAPGIPEGVERVILRALAKDADDRFQTMEEMVVALDAVVQAVPAEALADENLLIRVMASVREAIQAEWVRTAAWVAAGAVVLSVFFLVLGRVPLKVQIGGGRLEVVWAVNVTATSEAASVATATPTSRPSSTSTTTPTLTLTPTATALPTQTFTPTSTATPTPTPQPTVTPTSTSQPIATPPPNPTATPAPTSMPASRCPNPGVCITYPEPGATISGQVHVMGTANIEDFRHYKLEWWGEGGSEWSYLLKRSKPVVNGELMMLDTRTVPAGRYGLRLTVVDQTGNYPEPFEIWWTVEPYMWHIATPPPPPSS